jgi:hypothetical protein
MGPINFRPVELAPVAEARSDPVSPHSEGTEPAPPEIAVEEFLLRPKYESDIFDIMEPETPDADETPEAVEMFETLETFE